MEGARNSKQPTVVVAASTKTRTQNRLQSTSFPPSSSSSSSSTSTSRVLISTSAAASNGRPRGFEAPVWVPSKGEEAVRFAKEEGLLKKRERMMMVAIVAEILEVYTEVLARTIEHLLREAPLPRRVRFLILRSLPFASPPRHRAILAPAPVPAQVAA